MSFYGNITNTARSPFTFDRIYSSRYAMEQNMTSDGVYAGRYVLVEYDKDFSNIEFHRAYRDVSEAKEDTHTLYKDSACTIPVTVQQNPGEIDAPEVGTIFYTVENSTFISEVFWISARDALKIETNTDPSGQNYYIIRDGEKCYFDREFVAANDITLQVSNNSTSTHSLVQVFSIVQTGYAFYECQGSNSEGENEDETEDFTASFIYLALGRGNYAAGTIENYLSNHTLDLIYYNRLQGYDSTVWQKIYVDEEEKYIMIADLNTQAPTITASADAPSSQATPPHFDPSSSNTMYDLHLPAQWGFRVKAADRTLSEGGMIYDEESSSYVPFFEQTARYCDEAIRALIEAEQTYYSDTVGAQRLWTSNYSNYKTAIENSLQQLDPVPTLPANFFTNLENLLQRYDTSEGIKFILSNETDEDYIQLQVAGDGIPTMDYHNNKLRLYTYLLNGEFDATDGVNPNGFSTNGGIDFVFENLVNAIFYEYYYYQTSIEQAEQIYAYAKSSLTETFTDNVKEISFNIIDVRDNEEKLDTYIDLVLSTISNYEYNMAFAFGSFDEEVDNIDKVSVFAAQFTAAKQVALNKIEEYSEDVYFSSKVIDIFRSVLREISSNYDDILITESTDEEGEYIEINPLTEELISNKTTKNIEDINYYLRQIINTGLHSDANVSWLNIQNDTKYYFDGVSAEWTEDENKSIAGEIYFNKDGFDSSIRSRDNATTNNISISPTGYGQYYNPETKEWETYKYNVENRTIYGEKTESPDVQELSIQLPAVGNTISDVWDLTYGKQRNKDIAWESRDPNKLQLTTEKPDGSGFTYTPTQVETIAGVINSTQNLMGKIIIENPENYRSSGEFSDSSKVYNLLDDDHIYYFTEDSSYYRRAWDYDYSKIPDNDGTNNYIIETRDDYVNKVQKLNQVDLVNPYNMPRRLEEEFSEYTLAHNYDENMIYYRKDGDEYIQIPNNLMVFQPDTYYIKKPSGTYYYKDGENYYWKTDYQSGRKYYLIKSTPNPFKPKVNEYRHKLFDQAAYPDFNWSTVMFNPNAHALVSEQDYTWGEDYYDLSEWESSSFEKCYLWQSKKYYTKDVLRDEEGRPITRIVNGEPEEIDVYTLKKDFQEGVDYYLKTKNDITSVEFDEETQEYQYYTEQAAQYSRPITVGQIGDGFEYFIKKEDLFACLLTTITDTSGDEPIEVHPFDVTTAFTAVGTDQVMMDAFVQAIQRSYQITYDTIVVNSNVTIHKANIGAALPTFEQDNPAINFDGYLEVLGYVDNTSEDNAYLVDDSNNPVMIEPPQFYRLDTDKTYVEKYEPNGYYYVQKTESDNTVIGYILDTSDEGSADREYVTISTYPIEFKIYEPGKYYYPINDFDYRFVLASDQPEFTQVGDSSSLSDANFNVFAYYKKEGTEYSRAFEYEDGETYYTSNNFDRKEYYIHNTGDNSVEAPYIRAYTYDETLDYYIKEYDTSTMDYAVSLLPAVSTMSVQGYIPRAALESLTEEELDEVVTVDVIGDYFYYAYSAPMYEIKYKEAPSQPTTAEAFAERTYYVKTGEDSYTHPADFISGVTYYIQYQAYTTNVETATKVYISVDTLREIIANKKEHGELAADVEIRNGTDIPYKYTLAQPQPIEEEFDLNSEKYYVKNIYDGDVIVYEHLSLYNPTRLYYTRDEYFTSDGTNIPLLYTSDDFEYIQLDNETEFDTQGVYFEQVSNTYTQGTDSETVYDYQRIHLTESQFNARDKSTLYIRDNLAGKAEYTVLYKGYNAYDENLTYYEYTPYYVTKDYLEYRAGQRWDQSVGWENFALSITDDYFDNIDYYVDNAGQVKAQFYEPNEYYYQYEPDIYYIEDVVNTYYKISDENFNSNETYYYDMYGQVEVKFYEPNKYYYESIGAISKDSSGSLSNSKLYYLDKNGHEQIFFETYEANAFYYGAPTTIYTLDSRTYFDESATYYEDNGGTKITISLVPYYPNMYYVIETPIASVYDSNKKYFTSTNNANNTTNQGLTLSQLEFEQHDWYTRSVVSNVEYIRAGYYDANETYYQLVQPGNVYMEAPVQPNNTVDFSDFEYYIQRTTESYVYTKTTTYNANVEYWLKLSKEAVDQNATYVLIGNLTEAEFNNTTYYTREYKLCDDATVNSNKTYYTNTNGTIAANLYKPNTYYIANETIVGTLDNSTSATSGREYFYDEFLENRVYLTTDYAANKYYSATVSYVQDTAATITPYRIYYSSNNATNPVRLETYYKGRFYIEDTDVHYRICTDENVDTSKTYYTDLNGTNAITFNNGYTLAEGIFVPGATYYTLVEGVYEEVALWEYQPNMFFINHGDNAETIINCKLVPKDYLDKKDDDGLPLFKTYYLKILDGFARDYNTIHGLILRLNQWMNKDNATTRDLETIQGALNALQDQIRRLGAYDYSTIYNLNNTVNMIALKAEELIAQIDALNAEVAAQGGYATRDYVLDNFLLKHHPGDPEDDYVEEIEFEEFKAGLKGAIGVPNETPITISEIYRDMSINDNLKYLDDKIGKLDGKLVSRDSVTNNLKDLYDKHDALKKKIDDEVSALKKSMSNIKAGVRKAFSTTVPVNFKVIPYNTSAFKYIKITKNNSYYHPALQMLYIDVYAELHTTKKGKGLGNKYNAMPNGMLQMVETKYNIRDRECSVSLSQPTWYSRSYNARIERSLNGRSGVLVMTTTHDLHKNTCYGFNFNGWVPCSAARYFPTEIK